MIYIDAKKVIENRIAESMGFDKYKQIMEMVWKTDVSTNPDFQRTFNAFYRVRRNAEWRKAYYNLFEKAKDSKIANKSVEDARGELDRQRKETGASIENLGALTAIGAYSAATTSYMFYNLLAHLDSYFLEQIWKMKDIVATEGVDYRAYKPESKKCIAAAASTACTIKAVLDTPILTQEGELTDASEKMVEEIGGKIYK